MRGWPPSSGQILANVIIFICGNLAGAYHKHLMDLALKQTYQDTCNCIKSPIKLEFEKHQQVRENLESPANLHSKLPNTDSKRPQSPPGWNSLDVPGLNGPRVPLGDLTVCVSSEGQERSFTRDHR